MASETLNCGLIGAGRIGKLHAEHLCWRIQQANLLMVADADEEVAQECAELCRVTRVSTDFREILNAADIQAVIICSSTDTHCRIIEESAVAGKHVFCEKPIDHDLGRIDRALAAVEKAGVLLQIGFNRRFDASFRRVRKAVADGEIGEPHLVHITSRDPALPPIEYLRNSGGIFFDMTIHDFDMARFLVGREVEEVYATGSVRIDPAVAEMGDLDTVVVMLKFDGGVVCTIENSRQAVYGYDQRVEVFGGGGSIRVDNNFPNAVTIGGKKTIYRDLPLNFFVERYADSYLEEMQQFVNAVLSGAPPPVSGQDGRVPTVMGHAAQLSSRENRPVRLDEFE